MSCRPISPQPSGLSAALLSSSRRTGPACLPSEPYAREASSVSPPPSAKAPSAFSSSTRSLRNSVLPDRPLREYDRDSAPPPRKGERKSRRIAGARPEPPPVRLPQSNAPAGRSPIATRKGTDLGPSVHSSIDSSRSRTMKESSFEGVGGLKIATRSWQPAGKPRAVMILIHGFNAHSAYFAWAAEQFAGKGLACYALDLRGRGKSEGERFYVEKFSDYLGDVDKLVQIARSENPGLPVFVLGHSAGGVIATSYVFEHQREVAGLVCASFAYDVGLPD